MVVVVVVLVLVLVVAVIVCEEFFVLLIRVFVKFNTGRSHATACAAGCNGRGRVFFSPQGRILPVRDDKVDRFGRLLEGERCRHAAAAGDSGSTPFIFYF